MSGRPSLDRLLKEMDLRLGAAPKPKLTHKLCLVSLSNWLLTLRLSILVYFTALFLVVSFIILSSFS